MAKKGIDATNDMLPKGKEYALDEIGDKGGVERMSETNFVSESELEIFMHEPVKVIVHESQTEGALDIITPTVNLLNQPIIRGVETIIKRKYVEALARARQTKISQVMDPREKDKIKTVEKTVLTYPFSVIEDKNPKGREWLKSILAAA